MANKLLDMLMKNSKSKFTNTIQKSKYFNKTDEFITTSVKLLNVALSGEIDGGLGCGVTMIAGKPKRFKTLYGLTLVKAFLDKNPEGICLYYDTEGGAGKRYFQSLGIDVDRVLWTPCCTVEELKIEVVNQLEILKTSNEDNKVMFFVDSVGNPASKKELDDAIEGSNKADMTRAKQIKSFFRLVTLPTKLLDIPMVVINHTYDTQAFIPEEVVSGGTGGAYASDNVLIINKRQIKDSENALDGFTFEINIKFSRFVKEKSKLPINVYFDRGIAPYSGLDEVAVDFKVVESIKIGKSKGLKLDALEIPIKDNDFNVEFWELVLKKTNLKQLISDKYKISKNNPITIDEE
jgi:RecA/RadA recombinase